jgi:hypothetical protein
VIIAKWSHLFPYRTQKLSTLAATIAMHAIVKIARRQVMKLPKRELFYVLALIPKKLDLLHVYAYFVSLNISKIQSAQLQSKDLDAVSIKQDIHCLVYK